MIAYAGEDKACRQYADKIEVHYDLNVKQTIAQGIYYMFVSTFLVNTCVQAALLYMGSLLVRDDGMEVEVLLAFMLYQGQLQEYTLQIFQSYTALLKSSGAGEKVFELLDRNVAEPGVGSGENKEKQHSSNLITHDSLAHSGIFAGAVDVSFSNVSFVYPSRPNEPVLQNISLDIPRGSTVALCGSSGSGKSTVISLIERFYDADSGAVRINGVNVKEMDCHLLRRNIGVVNQEPLLFSGTIMENIIYGLDGEGGGGGGGEALSEVEIEERAIEAATIANAHSFITSFEKGYNTVCGERGVALSGGQKQRIAIARAILKKPALLLCDEATASLDNESEQAVQRALDTFLSTNGGKTTTIVVAHRLRTIRNCDYIAVIKEGAVAEWGNHQELVSIEGGLYAKMLASG